MCCASKAIHKKMLQRLSYAVQLHVRPEYRVPGTSLDSACEFVEEKNTGRQRSTILVSLEAGVVISVDRLILH